MNDYKKNGYKIFRNVVPTSTIDEIVGQIKEIADIRLESLGVLPGNTIYDSLLQINKIDQIAYQSCLKTAQYLPIFNQLGISSEILNALKECFVVKPVLSTRPVLHCVSQALLLDHGYNFTPPHQDWPNIQGSIDLAVVWVPFMEVKKEAYTLQVVPQSHKLGMLPWEITRFGQSIREDDASFRKMKFIDLEMQRGDLVVFSGFLVHRTSKTGNKENVRLAASFRFNNLEEKLFVKRNYPNPYIYTPQREMVTPNFPTLEDINNVFGE